MEHKVGEIFGRLDSLDYIYVAPSDTCTGCTFRDTCSLGSGEQDRTIKQNYGPCMRMEREDGVGVIFVNYKYQDMRAGNEETLRKVISEIIQKEKAADRSGESKKIPIDWDQVKLDLIKSVVLGLSVYNGGGNIIPIICNSSRTDHEVEMAAKRTANFVKTLVAELKKGGEDE